MSRNYAKQLVGLANSTGLASEEKLFEAIDFIISVVETLRSDENTEVMSAIVRRNSAFVAASKIESSSRRGLPETLALQRKTKVMREKLENPMYASDMTARAMTRWVA